MSSLLWDWRSDARHLKTKDTLDSSTTTKDNNKQDVPSLLRLAAIAACTPVVRRRVGASSGGAAALPLPLEDDQDDDDGGAASASSSSSSSSSSSASNKKKPSSDGHISVYFDNSSSVLPSPFERVAANAGPLLPTSSSPSSSLRTTTRGVRGSGNRGRVKHASASASSTLQKGRKRSLQGGDSTSTRKKSKNDEPAVKRQRTSSAAAAVLDHADLDADADADDVRPHSEDVDMPNDADGDAAASHDDEDDDDVSSSDFVNIEDLIEDGGDNSGGQHGPGGSRKRPAAPIAQRLRLQLGPEARSLLLEELGRRNALTPALFKFLVGGDPEAQRRWSVSVRALLSGGTTTAPETSSALAAASSSSPSSSSGNNISRERAAPVVFVEDLTTAAPSSVDLTMSDDGPAVSISVDDHTEDHGSDNSKSWRLRSLTLVNLRTIPSDDLLDRISLHGGSWLRSLDLSGATQLTGNDIRRLIHICPNLEDLCLRNCGQITSVSLDGLPLLRHLRSLRLTGLFDVTAQVMRYLIPCRSLRHLDLSYCHMLDGVAIQKLIYSAPETGSLRESQDGRESNSLQGSGGMGDACGIATLLHRVDFAKCPLPTNTLLYALPRFTALRALSLRHCEDVIDSVIERIAASCRFLRRLDLARCIHVGDDSMHHLSSRCALEALNVDGCALTDLGVAYLSRCSSRPALLGELTRQEAIAPSIDLTESVDGVKHIVADHPEMSATHANNNNNNDGRPALTQGWPDERSRVSSAPLEIKPDVDVKPEIFMMQPPTMMTASSAILGRRTLRWLSLEDCDQITDEGLTSLCLQPLEHLSLYGCSRVTGAFVEQLAASPVITETLHFADFSFCHHVLSPAGLALVTACKQLRVLRLWGHELTAEIALELRSAAVRSDLELECSENARVEALSSAF